MTATDPRLQFVTRQLRVALWLELFIEFSFVTAMAATLGAFNGGLPTSTPPIAQAYFVVGFLVTIAVAVRTRQMLNAAARGDLATLRQLNPRAWVWVAFVFSATLPSFYLYAAAVAMPRE